MVGQPPLPARKNTVPECFLIIRCVTLLDIPYDNSLDWLCFGPSIDLHSSKGLVVLSSTQVQGQVLVFVVVAKFYLRFLWCGFRWLGFRWFLKTQNASTLRGGPAAGVSVRGLFTKL